MNKTINDLNKQQATLYRSYVKANQMDVNQQAQIDAYMDKGKAGHKEIIGIVELMKVNNESTAKIKTQVSRASGKQKTGLSLQGLGKDDNVIIAPKKDSTKPAKDKQEVAEKAPKPEDSVEANTKSFDFDELDKVFIAMATDQQKVMIKHLTKLMNATTKLRLAS
jgi:hypothetical protein